MRRLRYSGITPESVPRCQGQRAHNISGIRAYPLKQPFGKPIHHACFSQPLTQNHYGQHGNYRIYWKILKWLLHRSEYRSSTQQQGEQRRKRQYGSNFRDQHEDGEGHDAQYNQNFSFHAKIF